MNMKLIAQLKLLPTPEQADALKRTLETANDACTFVGREAWKTKTFGQYDLHHLCYKPLRERFPLTAQMAVRVIAKVADAYKLDRKTKRTFRASGSIAYDDRILSWRLADSTVSIWTVDGRQRIPFVCGEHQRRMLANRQGETDLSRVGGRFYLAATCNAVEPDLIDVQGVLGVDLGVVNLAVDSDGEVHSASHINHVRFRHRRLRARLQAKGTRRAKRKLKQLSGKEQRFAKDTNHRLSKQLVTKAKDTRRAIALEDLGGIRERVTVRRHQRATLHSWAFFQLRTFVEYKARLAGVPVVLVNPRNTSRTCPVCGHIDKANRKSQSHFSCVACHYSGLADHIAAINIGRRADVNRPNVARAPSQVATRKAASAAASHPLLAGGR